MSDIISYPKGDLRRMLLVLGVIDATTEATLVKIAAKSGLDKTVSNLIHHAAEQAHVSIEKSGPVYTIASWGPIIKKSGARMALTGALNAPKIVVSKHA